MKIGALTKLVAWLTRKFPDWNWEPLRAYRAFEASKKKLDDLVEYAGNPANSSAGEGVLSRLFARQTEIAVGGAREAHEGAAKTLGRAVDDYLLAPIAGPSGLVFHGALYGGVAAAIVYREDVEDLFDRAFEEIEGVWANAMNDARNASAPVSAELEEDSGTIAVMASAHNDYLSGNSESNYLSGEAGNDTLLGGGGDDILIGGTGADVIDGGEGEDTASYSESDAGVRIDLVAGTGSGGHAEGDQLSNIESVIGSNHDDTLKGTDGSNVLAGGAGNDVLEGRSGDDVLIGGAGADVLDGGEGFDVADYSESDAGVVIDLPDQAGSGGHAEGDQLSGVEHLVGSNYDDRLIGTDGWNNVLSGGAGNDVIEGRGGDDILVGGTGADVLDGGEGIDTVFYNASGSGVVVDLASGAGSGGDADGDQLSGIESVIGSEHGDSLSGDEGVNLLSGGEGDDVLDGRGGDDYLIGGAGADMLNGAEGEDVADYTASSAGVTVDLGSGAGSGGDAEGDLLGGVDHLLGSGFDDVLLGQEGWDNMLAGGYGNDALDGRGGDDNLVGGAGNDLLTGGEGNDTFVFTGAIGHDIITDFETGDVIELSAADEDFMDGYSVLQAAEQAGNDVIIRLDAERSITLANTQLDALRYEDFAIAA